MEKEAVLRQLDALLGEYRGLRARSQYDDLSDLGIDLDRIVARMRAAVDRLAPAGSNYRRQAEGHDKEPPHVGLDPLVGILSALRDDVAADWLETVAELLHADTFDDFLAMADELLSTKYKDAAAVVAGAVLESHLRLLSAKYLGAGAGGPAKKADALNAELAGAGVYNKLQQKIVTGWLAIRNAAAHGQFGEYSAAQVENLIGGIREFVLRYSA